MDCNCIKKNYDFTLQSLSTKKLSYQDFSDWMVGDQYIKPDTYTIQIKTPNSLKTTDVEVNSTGVNILTSEDLGGGDGNCIPEGVYCFTVETCGNKATRYTGVTADLECRIACMISRDVDPILIAKLQTQIKSIHYSLGLDMTIEANKIYKVVKREIDLIECDCSCCK